MLHQIGIGEGLWAFTRKIDRRYALAAELVISAKTMNPRGFRYGPYRVWGDLRRSRYFGVDEQPDICTLIRSLAVKAKADVLGSSFQGKAAIRALSETDHIRLLAYAEALPLELRARLLPEEKLEALLLAGDEDAVARLLTCRYCGGAPPLPDDGGGSSRPRSRRTAPRSLRWRVPNLRLGAAPQLRGNYAKRITSAGSAEEAMMCWQISCSSVPTIIAPYTVATRRSTSSTMLLPSPG